MVAFGSQWLARIPICNEDADKRPEILRVVDFAPVMETTRMDPAEVLQELFEEAIPAGPREPSLRRRQRAGIARTQARLALERLQVLGFVIVANPEHAGDPVERRS